MKRPVFYCERCAVAVSCFLQTDSRKQCPHCGGPLKRIGRQSKYRAQPMTIRGRRFASKREGRRYLILEHLQQAGKIEGLELQPRYPCVVNGVKVCVWIGDFRYVDKATTKVVIEDAKGYRTPLYRLKKKLVEALYSITITEV